MSDNSWLTRIKHIFNEGPEDIEDLKTILHTAADEELLEANTLSMLEGVLDVQETRVKDVMVPRTQMVTIEQKLTLDQIIPLVSESGHSRYPVIGETIDEVVGILLAKDLLPLLLNREQPFFLETILRPANIIPESKRLNVLLKEFREKRYHMAVIIDEYGGISGLVTIEDILEEIVGEIEDETDDDEDDFIRRVSDEDYIVKALTPIKDFNDYFDAYFDDTDFDTIGGIITHAFGHMPARNEVVELEGYRFRILYADNRQIHLVRLTKI
jgi:magnesium and cobalt transporter